MNCRHVTRYNGASGQAYCTRCGRYFGPLTLEFWGALLLRVMRLR